MLLYEDILEWMDRPLLTIHADEILDESGRVRSWVREQTFRARKHTEVVRPTIPQTGRRGSHEQRNSYRSMVTVATAREGL